MVHDLRHLQTTYTPVLVTNTILRCGRQNRPSLYAIVVGTFIWESSGGLPYKNEGDARRKIKIKPLRETNVGVAQA